MNSKNQPKLDPITSDFIEIFNPVGRAVGVDNLTVTIMGILFIEPHEISMEELANKSGYSLASISQKIKTFTPLKIIKKTTHPGSRKVYLYMEKDIFETWKTQIIQTATSKLKIIKDNVPHFLETHRATAKSKSDKEKLKIINTYYYQALEFEKILKNLLIEIEKHQLKLQKNGK